MPRNQLVLDRLESVRLQLMAGHAGGANLSPASRGREREDFAMTFLEKCLPPHYRFGTGDVTDAAGIATGQLDLVVEYPFLPSFPMIGSSPRLYFAEGVAAVIEVKSDLTAQWAEVEATAKRVKALTRVSPMSSFGGPQPRLPLLAVGYRGWKSSDPLQERITSGLVDGILVLEHSLFAATDQAMGELAHPKQTCIVSPQGPDSLLALLHVLYIATRHVVMPGVVPLDYMK